MSSVKIFLLEIAVIELTINADILEQNSDNCGDQKKCVSFQFLELQPLVICDSNPQNQNAGDPKLCLKNGKSCMFPLPIDDIASLAGKDLKLRASAFVQLTDDTRIIPSRVPVGEAEIDLSDVVLSVARSVLDSPAEVPVAKSLTAETPFRGAAGQEAARLQALVRLTCHGDQLVSRFELDSNKSFLVRSPEEDTSYRCNEVSAEDRCLDGGAGGFGGGYDSCKAFAPPAAARGCRCGDAPGSLGPAAPQYPQGYSPAAAQYPQGYSPAATQYPLGAYSPAATQCPQGSYSPTALQRPQGYGPEAPQWDSLPLCACHESLAPGGSPDQAPSPLDAVDAGRSVFERDLVSGLLQMPVDAGGLAAGAAATPGDAAADGSQRSLAAPGGMGFQVAAGPQRAPHVSVGLDNDEAGKSMVLYSAQPAYNVNFVPDSAGNTLVKISPKAEAPPRPGAAQDDQFLLRMSTVSRTTGKKNTLELELRTPRPPAAAETASRDTQYSLEDVEPGGKGKKGKKGAAKGKKGKKGKKK